MSPTVTVTVPRQCEVAYLGGHGDPWWTTPVVFGGGLLVALAVLALIAWRAA